MGRLGVHRHLAEEQGHRVHHPEGGRGAREGHVVGQHGVIVERHRIFARSHGAGRRQMAVEHGDLEGGDQILQQLAALVLPVMGEHGVHPFIVRALDGDAAHPFLLGQELLVGLGQVFRLHQVRIVGGRIVIGVDAIPLALGIARRGHDVLGLRRIEGQHHVVGQLVGGGRVDQVPGLLAGARLDGHAAHELRVRRAHIVHLDAGGLLENLPQRQALLLIGGGIDRHLPLGLGAREQGGVEPGPVCGRALGQRGGRVQRQRADDQQVLERKVLERKALGHGLLPEWCFRAGR